MEDPVLHLIAGPNGAGKSTLFQEVLRLSHLEFVNADVIAAQRWPAAALEHAYEAAAIAESQRSAFIEARRSFVAETVFSHESKVQLMRDAVAAGYLVSLHVVLIPEALAVARVVDRVANGGHDVPEEKVRGRFARLWSHVRDAIDIADDVDVYDNSSATEPFRLVATFARGRIVGDARWPAWTPADLRSAGRR